MRFKKTLAGSAALAAVVLTASSASAHPNYDVAVGGSNAAGSHAFTATTTGGVTFRVFDVSAGVVRNMSCTSATASGTVTSGPSVPNPVATITATTWSGCTGLGQSLTVTPDHTPAWELHGTSHGTSATNDQVSGEIRGVDATVTAPLGTCTFRVTGFAGTSSYFDEATQDLVVNETGFTGNLSVASATCGGNVESGDPADFVATYDVSVTGGNLTLNG